MDFLLTTSEKQGIIDKMRKKFAQIPNTGHMQIWLQRISFPVDPGIEFDEPLCNVVSQNNTQMKIWDNAWINSPALRKAIDPNKIIDWQELSDLSPVVPSEEIDLFPSY